MKHSFKRPFQPSITSYFGLVASNTDNDTNSTSQTPGLCPTLPPIIQSSLLNVGMRVRKSVPEGYKRRSKTVGYSHGGHTWNDGTGSIGLVPYCGILKVGGHSTQSVPGGDNSNHEDWDLGFSSSQDCSTSEALLNDTTVSPNPLAISCNNHNKRRRQDADEEDLDIEAQPVSPRSRPVSHTRMPDLDHLRAMAIPKSRRKAPGRMETREREMLDVVDFEEADFLRPHEWSEYGGDM